MTSDKAALISSGGDRDRQHLDLDGIGVDRRRSDVATTGRPGRYFRSIAVLCLMLGSLVPPIGEFDITYLGLAGVVIGLAAACLRRNARLGWDTVLIFLVFGVIAVPAVMSWPETPYGQDKLVRFCSLTLLSALAAKLIRIDVEMESFARAWIAFSVAMAALTLADGVVGANGRIAAFGNNPIWLARALCAGGIYLLWFAARSSLRSAWGALAMLVIVGGIAATGSRGPMLAYLVGVLIFVVSGSRSRVFMLSLVVLVVPGIWLGMTLLPGLAGSRVGAFLVDPTAELTGSVRSDLLQKTLPVIRDNPVGVGLGNWRYAAGEDYLFWPHNLYVEVAAESGWLPCLVLVGVVLTTFYKLLRQAPFSSGARLGAALLASEAFAVAVSGDLNARSFFFALAVGMGLAWGAASRVAR